jgi:hypothetical protein
MWLTKYTSPFATEHERFGSYFTDLGFQMDSHGNFVLDVGKSDTIFAAHLDTADRGGIKRVRRVVKNDLVSTDNKTILGADNRAGIAVLLHLLRHDIPGRYMLFVGEEAGRIGSMLSAKEGDGAGYARMICWDRMGHDSVISHQMGERSCSDEFAEELCRQYNTIDRVFGFVPDDGGTYTDSYSFYDYVPECTNISVGYMNQHTTHETQDLQFLVDVAEASVRVKWEELPTVQNPHQRESQWYGKYPVWDTGGAKNWKPWDDEDDYFYTPDAKDKKWLSGADSRDLLAAANSNVLTYRDVEDWLYNDPEEAAKLLWDLLKG